MNGLLLGLGGNLPGPWGDPRETLRRACGELSRAGLRIVRSSRVYATAPLGPGRQAPYLNAVLLIEASVAPAVLLRLLKRIERRAGRRFGTRWGPRCLDLDALDYGGRRLGWPSRRPADAPAAVVQRVQVQAARSPARAEPPAGAPFNSLEKA